MQRKIITLALSLLACPAWGALKVFDFSDAKINEPPPGFRSAISGGGPLGEWKIILDEAPTLLPPLSPNAPTVSKRPVVAQLSHDRTDERFPLLIFEGETFGDFTLTTRFKIVEGQEEQMAGVAFRIHDEKNYYYMRANALNGNFYFFKIVNGIRSAPIGTTAVIARGAWQEMTIECKGNAIRGLLNGKEAIPTLGDKSFTSGKIGFWTKSDSVSYFSDTSITYTPKEILAQALVQDTMQKFPRLQGLRIYAVTTNDSQPRIIASSDPEEIGKPAQSEAQDVIARNIIYHGKSTRSVLVTLPLHDNNGETVAAVRVTMKPFPGQTEKNAIARALPIVKQMEARVQSGKDLTQ